jgi:hypothetical protein
MLPAAGGLPANALRFLDAPGGGSALLAAMKEFFSRWRLQRLYIARAAMAGPPAVVANDSWISGSLVQSLSPTEFDDQPLDGNDSDMLDSILMEHEKHKTQVELLRACLAEAELERDAARRQAVPPPPPLSKSKTRSSWTAFLLVGLAVALAAGAVARQHRAALAELQATAQSLRGELQLERDKYIDLLTENIQLAEQNISCRKALEKAIAKDGAVGHSLSAYGVGPIQIVMSMADFVVQAGKRFIRSRRVAKIPLASE